MTKGIEKRIEEGLCQWFSHVERMENDRIARKVFVGECSGCRSMNRPRKSWNDGLKKRGLDIR